MRLCLEALLVEDSCSDAQLVETVVGLADHEAPPNLDRVDCFRKALSRLETKAFDIILLDLHLPDGEGTDLIRRLKQIAPQVPLVVMTGTVDRNTEAEAFSEGADDYLVKSHIFSPQRIAEIGYIDVGNLLVQRLHYTVQQFKLAAALEFESKPQSLSLLEQLYPSNVGYAEIDDSGIDGSGIDDSETGDLDARSEAGRPGISTPQFDSSTHPIEHFVQTTFYSVGVTLMSTLGLAHMAEGAYSQAESLLKGALEIRKRLLGPTHPDVIVSLHNLATLYDNQGHYLEAEDLFYEALKLCEEVFGVDSALTRKFRRDAMVISLLNQGMDRSKRI